MVSLRPNLIKRIERLPKPNNVATALQPLFEAISNAIHSTQSHYKDGVTANGKVHVVVETNRDKTDVWASVEDNGPGLNEENWDAFCTTDTANKIQIGGKGVGRLLWLDCFDEIKVSSVFEGEEQLEKREFRFVLELQDQIQELKESSAKSPAKTYFHVRFSGLRDNGYLAKFPGRGNFVFQHITSHFLPTFIGGKCPQMEVSVGEETRHYPEAIDEIVHRRDPELSIETEDYGALRMTLMECDKVASADLKGHHFVHFIAHDRTVHSQCIDGKLGLKYFGSANDRVFHCLLVGDFLDQNVNQERTAFQFEDAVKRPGRTSYNADENPQMQVERYVRQLQSGSLSDVKGRPIKFDSNTIFYCFIVADIVGKLDEWTHSWQRTADGRGRIYRPNHGFHGSVELIGWDDLISDASARNQAFFDKAGISGKSFFSAE